MSYSLIVLPAVVEDLATTLREREQFGSGRALLAERTEIVTLAVLHQRRDPALWPKR
jgi:hypothetical protein